MDRVFEMAMRVSTPLMLAAFAAAALFLAIMRVLTLLKDGSTLRGERVKTARWVVQRLFVLSTATAVFGLVGFVVSASEPRDAQKRLDRNHDSNVTDGVGGLVGSMIGGAIVDSSATGDIIVTGQAQNVGGLVGRMEGGTISGSHFTGTITVGPIKDNPPSDDEETDTEDETTPDDSATDDSD